MSDNLPSERIDYVVGQERSLCDTLSGAEIMPLMAAILRAGASRVALLEANGKPLWSQGKTADRQKLTMELPLSLEGEVVGTIVVDGPQHKEEYLRGLFGLFADAVQTILTNNLKRMLTTEIHTTVVNQSYEELLAANRSLTVSEGRYRELSENLEKKVRERTEELQKTHSRLLQQEKMAAVGQLAAGMAHEINNPLGFVTSNLHTLDKYIGRFREMLAFCRMNGADNNQISPDQGPFAKKWQELKLDFIIPDIEELMTQSIEGCARIKKIIADLKSFSHIDEVGDIEADLNQEIDRTLSVMAHLLPADAVLTKHYAQLPPFSCNAALICQVFLSIILNAVQVKPAGLRLLIETRYQQETRTLLLRFADNGPGMTPAIAKRIFEPFFTTKEVGTGTGMGLATAYDIINSCGGSIEVESTPGAGTAFLIKLPATRT